MGVLNTGYRAVVVVLAGLMLPSDGKHGDVAMVDDVWDRTIAGLQLLWSCCFLQSLVGSVSSTDFACVVGHA